MSGSLYSWLLPLAGHGLRGPVAWAEHRQSAISTSSMQLAARIQKGKDGVTQAIAYPARPQKVFEMSLFHGFGGRSEVPAQHLQREEC